MTSEFRMTMKDYGLIAEITCTDTSAYPNHSDLREALNRLMHSLGNWESVDIVIKTVEES